MGYKILLILEVILMALPKSFRKAFFILLANIGYRTSARYRKVARDNLDFLFADKMSDEEKESIVKYSFKNLLLNFLHVMELRHMSLQELEQKVTVTNKEIIDKIHSEGRAVIYVTTHYSSWELGGASLGAFVEPLAAVYKRMKNRVYEEWLLEGRARFGNSNLEKTGVVKPLIKLIKQGKASGILIDTNISPNEGVKVQFMGKTINQTYSPAYLARKFNAAIVPVTMRTDDEENYTLIIYDEIPVYKTDDEKQDILKATQLQADWLSDLVTKEPKFWFWLHRRFKNEYPEIYS